MFFLQRVSPDGSIPCPVDSGGCCGALQCIGIVTVCLRGSYSPRGRSSNLRREESQAGQEESDVGEAICGDLRKGRLDGQAPLRPGRQAELVYGLAGPWSGRVG